MGGGSWLSDKMELVLISTQFEVVVEVGLEKVLKRNFHGWVGGWVGVWQGGIFFLASCEPR